MDNSPASDPESAPSVVSLHVALATRLPNRSVDSVEVDTGHGITGDRYHAAKHRHLTVQSLEELALAEAEIDRPIDPSLTRRNVTISHGALVRTPGARLTVGTVELEVVRDAAPCKLLEDALGRDAKLALHKRAGVVCRTLDGGRIAVGDRATIHLKDN